MGNSFSAVFLDRRAMPVANRAIKGLATSSKDNGRQFSEHFDYLFTMGPTIFRALNLGFTCPRYWFTSSRECSLAALCRSHILGHRVSLARGAGNGIRGLSAKSAHFWPESPAVGGTGDRHQPQHHREPLLRPLFRRPIRFISWFTGGRARAAAASHNS